LPSLSQDVAPEQVLDHLEHVERSVAREQEGGGAEADEAPRPLP
jgi:hypothetical protein